MGDGIECHLEVDEKTNVAQLGDWRVIGCFTKTRFRTESGRLNFTLRSDCRDSQSVKINRITGPETYLELGIEDGGGRRGNGYCLDGDTKTCLIRENNSLQD